MADEYPTQTTRSFPTVREAQAFRQAIACEGIGSTGKGKVVTVTLDSDSDAITVATEALRARR